MMRGPLTAAIPFTIIGTGCVAAGGLVSAATAPAPSEQSAWAVAYLVLVPGLAQVLLGIGRALLSATPPQRQRLAVECLAWNVANAAILTGTLTSLPPLLYSGAALLLVDLGLLSHGGRGASEARRWLLYAYRALAVLLAVSVPVGLALAALRPE